MLRGISENLMVALNHAVAFAMIHGPAAGLDLLTTIAADKRIAGHHRLTRSARTCWRWPTTTPRRPRSTGSPRAAPRACPSSAT
ncbi:hypothetical protein [Actinophytocola algeriensis]|uniref:Uncharacterized protein n=1 Tax=Actinophytocola algeriensis TaxID=1768010 RepID=A0A7W7Q4U1_9PSEU|nr:hypothetical protein [Actinophytocola algeriensis]MBB4907097.1 hypothetical protein [Actinophytocola algeriensis]MBE1478580.1 hypothetical protein [Actinophytocola algeriensis]